MKGEWGRNLAACVFLWTAAAPDLRTRRIPVWIPAIFFLFALAMNLFCPGGMGRREIGEAIIPGAVLLLFSLAAGGRIGEGDGICLIVCGCYVGAARTVLIAQSALLLAAGTGALLLATKRLRAEDSLPFVPFLAAACSLLIVLEWIREGSRCV